MIYRKNRHKYKVADINDRTYDGIVFDSKKEMKRYKELVIQMKNGIISGLQRQVKFELQEPYINNKGQHIRAINYVADFVYEKDGKIILEDVKGFVTDVYKIKKKMFEKKYKEVDFREVK